MSRYESPITLDFTAVPTSSTATQSPLECVIPASFGADKSDINDTVLSSYTEAEFYHYHLLSFIDLLERGIGQPDTMKIAVKAIGDVAHRVEQAKPEHRCNWDRCNRVMFLMIDLIDALLESLQGQYERRLDVEEVCQVARRNFEAALLK